MAGSNIRILEQRRRTLPPAQFHVSRESIFRKFLDRGLIDQATYSEATDRWTNQQRASTGGDYYNNQVAYLGTDYVGLVLNQLYQGRISESQAADYLTIAVRNLATFEARFARRKQ
jgi:Zn-dependent peptidase ImmA (M78 family)